MKGNAFSSVQDSDKEQSREEYLILFAAFQRLLNRYHNEADRWESIEEIVNLRTSYLVERILTGLRIDFDKAIEIIRSHNSFNSQREREERDILIAGINNVIEFAAAEEYYALGEVPKEAKTEDRGLMESVFKVYNQSYAQQENSDVLYAAITAYWWLSVSSESLITFMTQGDERVRAWHLSLEGQSFPKSEFPPELIPPIEYGCRCYLISNGFDSVMGNSNTTKFDSNVNPVFKESLSTGGRIFSSVHPYFRKPLPEKLTQITKRIKEKLYLL